jgi:hypothetical protein
MPRRSGGDKEEKMERRDFLKLALGMAGVVAVGAAVTQSQAAPMMPSLGPSKPGAAEGLEPAIATDKDLDGAAIKPVQWGWRRRRWRRRVWRRRVWRRRYYW